MNDNRAATYPFRQQFICPQHPPNVFASYCIRCSVPLCLECQDIHTDLHYKNNIPAQLKSIIRIQEETESKLREALGTYRRYIQSIESIIKNPVHYDRVLEEIDTAHRNLVKDINRFFVNLKLKYEDLRRMADFHAKLASLTKRESELEDQLLGLGYQKTLEIISSANSEKFFKEWEKDARDVEGIVEKNKQYITSAVVSEEELQNILRYNIDRYVDRSRYLKSRLPQKETVKYNPLPRFVQTPNENRASSLNRSVVLKTQESADKDTDRKNDRSLSLERSPFSSLKQEILASNGNSINLTKNGLNALSNNSPHVSFTKPRNGNYSEIRAPNEIKLNFSTIDGQNPKYFKRAGNTDRIKTPLNNYSPIK